MRAEDVFAACRHKQASVDIEGLPERLDIAELTVGARMALVDIDDAAMRLATIVRGGVPLFKDIEEQELIDRLPFDAMIAISNEVLNLSGVGDDEPKKSD